MSEPIMQAAGKKSGRTTPTVTIAAMKAAIHDVVPRMEALVQILSRLKMSVNELVEKPDGGVDCSDIRAKTVENSP